MVKKFKSIEELWAYAKQIMPNGAVVSKIANTGASKFFSITVPKVLVQDSKLMRFSKIETVFTLLKGDNLIDAFCEQTNNEYTIVDSNDFREAIYFCAAMLTEGMRTRRVSLVEAITKVMAPIKVGDNIKIVSVDGDVETDIVSGEVEDMKPVKDVMNQIKKENSELYSTIKANGYKDSDNAYRIKGAWYVDDNEHNIYALLREDRAGSMTAYSIQINGKTYNSIWDIRKGLESFDKDFKDKGKMSNIQGMNPVYDMLKDTWNQIFAGSSKKNVVNEAAKENFKAIAIIQEIENGTKDIPTDKIKTMINSISHFQKRLLSDPEFDHIDAIEEADDAIDGLRAELAKRGMKDKM